MLADCVLHSPDSSFVKRHGHKFSLGCPIQALHILRCRKLNNGSYEEIQMVITFHSDVRFWCITYRDARNRTTEALEKFK